MEIDLIGRIITTERVINLTKKHFARYGRPSELRTDGDPRYRAKGFHDFCKEWNVNHVISSPHHHESNGKAEASVKAAKRLVKKCDLLGEDREAALLEWRSTRQKDRKYSPAEIFFNRTINSFLPTRGFEPKHVEGIKESIEARRENQKKLYDRGAQDRRTLIQGEQIRVKLDPSDKIWQPAMILQKIRDRTYELQTKSGRTYIRNAKFIQTLKKSPSRAQSHKDIIEASTLIIPKEPTRNTTTQLRWSSPRKSNRFKPYSTAPKEKPQPHQSSTEIVSTRNDDKLETSKPSQPEDRSDKVVQTRSGRVVKKRTRYEEDSFIHESQRHRVQAVKKV